MPKVQTSSPSLVEEIQRASAIKLTNVKSDNTVLDDNELIAFVTILTTYIKDHNPPAVGSYALYAWANNSPRQNVYCLSTLVGADMNFVKNRARNTLANITARTLSTTRFNLQLRTHKSIAITILKKSQRSLLSINAYILVFFIVRIIVRSRPRVL